MKIALLTDGVWPVVVGGMQKHTYYLSKYLMRQGVEIDLYYTHKQKREIRKKDIFLMKAV